MFPPAPVFWLILPAPPDSGRRNTPAAGLAGDGTHRQRILLAAEHGSVLAGLAGDGMHRQRILLAAEHGSVLAEQAGRWNTAVPSL